MKRFALAAGLVCAAATPGWAQQFYVSQILTLATNFCPSGTLPANGALMPITNNIALFSLLGTTYGGNGTTTFALPNLKPILTETRAPLTQCIVQFGIFPARN